MSAPAAVHPSESGHWYDREGRPAYEVLAKSGQTRPTTLRDARKLDLVPGVSTIIQCASSWGLENWKIDQGILAALTLPRALDETEIDWLGRVKQDASEQARRAAERGTEIHAAIQRWYESAYLIEEPSDVVVAVTTAVGSRFGEYLEWVPELAFANPLGFGGKADLLGADEHVGDVLLDFKTKDAWPEDFPPKGFEEHAMQLAAYRVGLGRPEAACANVFVSRTEPWQVHIHEWTEDEMQRGWVMFRSLLAFWKAKNNIETGWTEDLYDTLAF